MARYTGQGTILGGLPVVADVNWGYDSFIGEGYAEITEIFWRRRDGSKGKSIPDKVYERAEKYDPYFSCLIEQLEAEAAHENEPEPVSEPEFLTFEDSLHG